MTWSPNQPRVLPTTDERARGDQDLSWIRGSIAPDGGPSSAPAGRDDLSVIDLGQMPYAEALALQHRLNRAVCAGQQPPTLLLVEHPPVITLTARPGAREHLKASPRRLAALGIDVQRTDRGGDVTYHGPGQLVGYPIMPLGALRMNLGRYMRWLESIVIDTVAGHGVTAFRVEGLTGVWTRRRSDRQHGNESFAPRTGTGPAKLCAFGVRVRRQTTMHGLALNVTTNLSHFQTIVPCGLAGRPVTSLRQLLGSRTPTMAEVKAQLASRFSFRLRRLPVPGP